MFCGGIEPRRRPFRRGSRMSEMGRLEQPSSCRRVTIPVIAPACLPRHAGSFMRLSGSWR